ncbi:AraC family transcriptional regulator [Paraburkholderia oxyphila]|uniref:AraC family transcriptional regulator n=1 Tax=Paraburkholderia oxyphila TaxID=614212 RepID=UPI000488F181|nr:AraC family transcriptional regulator [Paraburkholderia oxyphila]
MPKLVRSASLTHYAEIARASGLDPYLMLAEVGLPADCLSEADLRIPAEKVALLLERSAQESGVETFGLLMAETRRASNLGPLALAVRDEPTLRHALNAAARYSHLQNEALFIRVEQDGNLAIIREELLAGEGVPVRQGAELALAVMFRLLLFFLGDEWHPKSVCFTHGPPSDRTVHTRIFGPNVEFGHAFTGIVCDVNDLKLPLPSADPVMGKYVRQYLGSEAVNQSLSDDVRKLVFLLLPQGRSTIDTVARHLGMSRRTAHRHLADEGVSFSSILEEVRGELALRHLERRERPFSEISGLLGFSEPSAFTRWFRTRFGSSPSQFEASAKRPRAKRKAG